MIIEKNTICYTSELGHNNFLYPTNNKVLVKESCEAFSVSWIGGGDKMPIKIMKSYLVPLNVSIDTTKNTSPPTKNSYTIVWINK
jgi:hypothetical protein